MNALAHHEAGHAIVMISFGIKIDTCSISPGSGDKHGHTTPASGAVATTQQSLVIAWAGPFAEMRFDPFADVPSSDQHSMKAALRDFRGSLLQ